jgi:toxin ParE1/3/4
MKLRFTQRAANDISEIADYIKAENPAAALRVRAAILESVDLLLQFPQIGRAQSVEGVRKLVVRKYPYLVYYAATDEEVVILTVQHPARERSYSDR